MAFFWTRTQPAPTAIRAEPARSARIDAHVSERVRPDGPGLAVAVVKSGAVVHAAGYGLVGMRRGLPIAQDTIFHFASCGKQFTGLGILMLAEERKLQLDDPVGKHLSGLDGFGPGVTIRRLLHHTSGIRDLYDDAGVEEVLARCERPTSVDLVDIYADLGCPMAGRRTRPGDTFSYSNSGYDLLGAVIEQVSGQTYHDFFQRRVFDRSGMKDTFSAPDRRVRDRRCATGYELGERGELVERGGSEFDDLVGSGSFYTTASDLCVYDQVLRTGHLVSDASMREALTSGQTNDGSPTNYGFGWYLGTYEGMRCADHEGTWIGFYSYVCRSLDRPLSIFLLSNNPEIELIEVANVAIAAYR
jgi:CubicO group peptidase (beta-lactamase class C family)